MALRRLGGQALRHAAAAVVAPKASAPPARRAAVAWAAAWRAPSASSSSSSSLSLPRPLALAPSFFLQTSRRASTVTTAIAAASAAAAVAKKVAAATAAATKTAVAARAATTGPAAAAVFARTLLARAGGALFEGGGGNQGAALAAGAAAVSAAVARGGGGGAAAASAAGPAASLARARREALLRHAAAVDRAFRLSRGRLPGTPFRIWRGLPFARVAARAAHGTALVALAVGHGCPPLLTGRLVASLAAESCLRAVPLAGGPLAYLVFERGGMLGNVGLLERWAAGEEARELRAAGKAAAGGPARWLLGALAPPWRRRGDVGLAAARRRKGWGVLGTARRAAMLSGAAAVLALLPAGVAATAVLTGARWVLAAFFDSGFG